MFAGQTNNLPYIRNYAEADAHWHKTKKPPRSKKWGENQRPLRNVSSWHYRMEKGEGFYDICLYHTVMARFYEPQGNIERRCYKGDGSLTSQGFMRNVLGVGGFSRRATTDGREVFMPIANRSMPDSDFSVDAVFIDNKLAVEASAHTRIYKKVSHEGDKHERKMIKAAFEPLFTLCAMQMQTWEQTLTADWNIAGSFYAAAMGWDHKKAIGNMVQAARGGEDFRPEDVPLFMQMAQLAYQKRISDRAMEEKRISWSAATCQAYEIEKRVTEKELLSSLWGYVRKFGNLNSQSGTVEYPQFPEPDQIVFSNVTTYAK